jgi:hypothetical protein
MKKLMSVIFPGLDINEVDRIIDRWNSKSGAAVLPITSPHERLEGVYLYGGATVIGNNISQPNRLVKGIVFNTSYSENSYYPSSFPTCFAFRDWLRSENVEAVLALHQEEPTKDCPDDSER